MKICKYCNTENTDSTSTCSSCGAKEFYYRCNNCASEVKNGKFCPNCGVKIGTKPKKCPNCNSEYYSNACPNCGYIKTNQNNAVAKKTYAGDANEIVPETERKKTGCLNVLIAYMAAVISMIIFFKGGFGLFWIILMIILVLYGSSITYKSNYCFNCKKPKSKSAKKCPYCNHSDERVIPFGLSIIVFIGFAILFFIFFASDFNPNDEKYIGNESSSSDNTVTSEIDTITNTNYIDSTYKNELSWALFEENYMFAVEVDDYNGDIYSAGTYEFYNLNTNLKEAGVYDIYIEEKELSSLDELGEIDYEIGGVNGAKEVVTLKQGDYVYIIPYKGLAYTPNDVLYMRIKE